MFDVVLVAVIEGFGDHIAFLRKSHGRCAGHVILKSRADGLGCRQSLVGCIGLRVAILAVTTTATTVAARTIVPVAALASFTFGARFVLIVFGACGLSFRFEQRKTICYRDLVVVRVDFRECEEAMAIATIFHERSLKRRFDAGNACEVDIAFQLLLVFRLKVEFFNLVAPSDDNPGLLRVGGIYKHFVGHYCLSCRRQDAKRVRRTKP